MNNARLLASKEQLEKILQHVADGITVQSKAGGLVYVNQSAAKIMGFSEPSEVYSVSVTDLLSRFEIMDENLQPLDIAELPGRLALKGEEEPAKIIGFRVRPHNKVSWSSVKASPIYDKPGEVGFVVNVFQDITDLKQTEIELREANNRITKLLETVLDKDILPVTNVK